jgi:hypothetical protein
VGDDAGHGHVEVRSADTPVGLLDRAEEAAHSSAARRTCEPSSTAAHASPRSVRTVGRARPATETYRSAQRMEALACPLSMLLGAVKGELVAG